MHSRASAREPMRNFFIRDAQWVANGTIKSLKLITPNVQFLHCHSNNDCRDPEGDTLERFYRLNDTSAIRKSKIRFIFYGKKMYQQH